MKTRVLRHIVLASVMALGIAMTISAVSYAATITVPTDYADIQDAINAATDGDTVYVLNDTYTPATGLTVNKNIILTGESEAGVIIRPVDGNVMTISGCESPVISSFTIDANFGNVNSFMRQVHSVSPVPLFLPVDSPVFSIYLQR